MPEIAPSNLNVANATTSQKPVKDGPRGGMQVEALPLQDRDRLGDELTTRLLREFPIELEFPVRLREKIVARYPQAALAAGREGSVAVWIVVDAQGQPDEIQITDGAEEFANAVMEAIRGAHFLPAQNNLLAIRFPISLEFEFKLTTQAGADGAVVPR